MIPFYLSMALIIVSIVLYHAFQKLTSASVNPFLALTITFATSTLCCLVLFFISSSKISFISEIRKLNWPSVALAFAIVGTDVGFLFAYRAGWKIGLGAIVANVLVTLFLLPVGWLFFRERFSGQTLAGVVACIGGMVLINYK